MSGPPAMTGMQMKAHGVHASPSRESRQRDPWRASMKRNAAWRRATHGMEGLASLKLLKKTLGVKEKLFKS